MIKHLKLLAVALVLMALVALVVPTLAMAEGEAAAAPVVFDWTALLVALIGAVGTVASALLARVWAVYVRPWLEQRNLTDAAQIVVDAVEALLGRYCGEDKWKLALEKMTDRGFYADSQQVVDALKAAWLKLDMAMTAAGEKGYIGEGISE